LDFFPFSTQGQSVYNVGLPDPLWEIIVAPLFKKITHSIFFTDLLQGLSI
jgi:hypothetical protein